MTNEAPAPTPEDAPICRYVSFDPDSPSLPIDVANMGSEPISFSVAEARLLRKAHDKRSEEVRPADDAVITHEQAKDSLQRLCNSHFKKEPCARISIPARPDYDDDLILMRYIDQQARREGARNEVKTDE